jgi:hypothetical protein
MASTLTRTAAALAVASLPLIAGATTAQAGDRDDHRDKGRDYCREDRHDNHKRTDEHKRGSGYDDPKSHMTIARYGEDKKKDWRDDNCQTHHKPPEHKPPRHDPPKHHPKHRDHHKRHDHVKHDPYNEVRTATAKYFSVAAAEHDGYARPASGPLRGCIAKVVGSTAAPAMGFHWINMKLVDTTVEATKPEALVYEPNKDGKLDFVAVEYIVPKAAWDAAGHLTPPKLFGVEFMLTTAPNRYEIPAFYSLHAWIWKSNPDGINEPFNPRVSCTYAGLLPK